MTAAGFTFWEAVRALREQGLIRRDWKVGDLSARLVGAFKPSTITVNPFNSSISSEGGEMGDFVKKGAAPKAWRVGRGLFRLVADPDDDAETQAAETALAARRAEELRAAHNRPGQPTQENPVSALVAPAEQEAQASSRYPSVPVSLTDAERQAMDGLSTERKAVHIVRSHLANAYGGRAKVEEGPDGADLRVEVDGQAEQIEVQGTDASTIVWGQLQVSGRESHDMLLREEAVMYRVVDVNGASPRIYMLKHGQHFTLEPQPTWAVKQAPPEDAHYPLRGEPYRYDRPYDAVAMDEWETRP